MCCCVCVLLMWAEKDDFFSATHNVLILSHIRAAQYESGFAVVVETPSLPLPSTPSLWCV